MNDSTIENQTQITQDNCEIISLMIQHLNNELPAAASKRIDVMIQNCRECKRLFDEVKIFFEDDFMYEILHKDRIEITRNNFQVFVSEKLQDNEKEILKYQYTIGDENSLWKDDCFCCD